jgi:dihydrofolate reductase
MRKLKLQVQISIDGFISAEDGSTDWLVWNWGPVWNWDDELKKYFNDLTDSVDCVLLSRKMAVEGFIDHWAKVAQNPNDPQFTFSSNTTKSRKVVFTKSLKQSTWDNTVLAKGDLVKEVMALKNEQGKDIIVYGGASFVSALIKAGLIDEYYLFVNPAALGKGLPIFSTLDNTMKLSLVKARSYDCGVAVLKYKSGT